MKNLLLAAIILSGCCANKLESRPLAESYRRWLNGPGQEWVEAAKDDPRFDQRDAMDRQARWSVASGLVELYEKEEAAGD